ncbi:pyrroline-5-carboxylate reductase dimerization domain-containing protein [Paraburkholderia sp. EG285A]|uniref:pyrroline-5-carboxylate reductase dimerization domain-containing protein n=1 Tax=Paraburkholderia sp. EG285A TaxID=3237009 RepID=UPI0034D1F459
MSTWTRSIRVQRFSNKGVFNGPHTVIPIGDERAFDALFAATSLMGSFFATLESHASWLGQQRVPYPEARDYLASLFHGLAVSAMSNDEPFSRLSAAFSTPGGLNEGMTHDLQSQGVFTAYAVALDRILARIQKG